MPLRLAAALAALLSSVPLQAQVVRGSPAYNPVAGSAFGGLGNSFALAPAPSLDSAISGPSLTPSIAAPSAAPVPSALTRLVIPAAAAYWSPGGSRGGARTPAMAATPADGWASRFNFAPADLRLFDGARAIKSDAGATFEAIPKGAGVVRVHLVERAPAAAPKAVPGTEGLTGKPLLDALKAFTSARYLAHPYNEASDYLFSRADHIVLNGVSGVVDAYSGIFVPGTGKDGGDYPEPGDPNGDGFPDKAGMNVEHTWPQSLFNKALPMRSDLHHLMATFMHPNSVRGSLPFGTVTGRPDYENKAGAKRGGGVFEPPDAVKGRLARGLLYFYVRYRDSRMFGRTSVVFWNQQIDLLMAWNRRFPPDAFEARRNDLVEGYQGNRNPFIDDHLLADRVGAAAFRAGIPSRGEESPGFRRSGRGSSLR